MILNSLGAHAQSEEPIISFHTNVYEKAKGTGVTPSVSFVLGAANEKQVVNIDCGNGEEEFDVDVAQIGENQSIKGSLYIGQVSKDGWVKIYGDPTKLYYFNASGNEIDEIKFSNKLGLRVLNLEHNVLTSLNIDAEKNMDFLEKVSKMSIPVILLINKIDESDQKTLGKLVTKWHGLLPNAEILPISAKNKFGVDILLKRVHELLPESPAFFDKDQLTDKPAKFFVSEIIREKILRYYDKEIPYSVEVVVERFKEDDRQIHISAIIYVERSSQKGIIIGHQGMALKKVSTEARKSLERFFDKKIFLETFVKVDKDWRNSQKELKHFGYSPE